MQPTSPAPRSEPRARDPWSSAFTLIEVLIALAMLTLLAFATASSLSSALRAGAHADLIEQGLAISDELRAEYLLSGAPSNTMTRHAAEWTFNVIETSTGLATNRAEWSVWEIVARERPSIQWRLAFERPER